MNRITCLAQDSHAFAAEIDLALWLSPFAFIATIGTTINYLKK